MDLWMDGCSIFIPTCFAISFNDLNSNILEMWNKYTSPNSIYCILRSHSCLSKEVFAAGSVVNWAFHSCAMSWKNNGFGHIQRTDRDETCRDGWSGGGRDGRMMKPQGEGETVSRNKWGVPNADQTCADTSRRKNSRSVAGVRTDERSVRWSMERYTTQATESNDNRKSWEIRMSTNRRMKWNGKKVRASHSGRVKRAGEKNKS